MTHAEDDTVTSRRVGLVALALAAVSVAVSFLYRGWVGAALAMLAVALSTFSEEVAGLV